MRRNSTAPRVVDDSFYLFGSLSKVGTVRRNIEDRQTTSRHTKAIRQPHRCEFSSPPGASRRPSAGRAPPRSRNSRAPGGWHPARQSKRLAPRRSRAAESGGWPHPSLPGHHLSKRLPAELGNHVCRASTEFGARFMMYCTLIKCARRRRSKPARQCNSRISEDWRRRPRGLKVATKESYRSP
jgi:hypothetical protein